MIQDRLDRYRHDVVGLCLHCKGKLDLLLIHVSQIFTENNGYLFFFSYLFNLNNYKQ